ncbi:Cytochrome b561 and DOMON domain-containing protein [Psilocybe cubensis]|uniref:Cytochrome b561 and DOMON domain-containing protein n=1 Tax=Psilocybe cubensis TaxID=181762 RepID=A0ACB8HBR2_PSICU|nr:Cytochrome b561 and DOMON domain-containing protein [Psilocybe cubensis]KAH9485363.1 Cytochrome b561 and DOMON domain-containing protein [Psilocybe cubensis]
MCIEATVNGSSTTYVLSSLGKQNTGWMAMGFGRQMTGTLMVIMWINPDGSVTLSQRSASDYVMPTVDSNPPRVAQKSLSLSVTNSKTPSLAYTIPSNTDTKQPIIYAFGTTTPSSSDENATLLQHLDMGILQLDLTKPVTATTPTDGSGGYPSDTTPATPDSSFSEPPLLPYQKLIVAHAIMCTVGFLFLLPLGALLARYLRTFIPTWFQSHWIVQFALGGPVILIGIILGIAAVSQSKAMHLDDDHKNPNRVRRPPQNYLHAVVGLAIIGLAFYQVHSGFDHEWTFTTGREPLPSVVKIVFYVWVVFLPVAYAVGLGFLPKQYRQEYNKVRTNDDEEEHSQFGLKETSYGR